MRGFLIGLLVLIIVVVGGGAIATTAYQAGLSQAVTTVAQGAAGAAGTTGTTVVVPAYGYGYGFGWHGFGFFGFFGFLLVLFLVFGLIRAIAFGGRGGWGRGWKGGGRWDGPGDHRHPFESRAREVFTELHREAHEGPSETPAAPADSTGPRTPSA